MIKFLFEFMSCRFGDRLAVDSARGRKGLAPVGEIIFAAGRVLVKLFPEESYRPGLPRQELVSKDIIKTETQTRMTAFDFLFVETRRRGFL
jgi:hypothetical protein